MRLDRRSVLTRSFTTNHRQRSSVSSASKSSSFRPEAEDNPSSVTQLAAAMAALGLYGGATTPAEHAAEARRLGGEDAYRVRLANALLGAARPRRSWPRPFPSAPNRVQPPTNSSSSLPAPRTIRRRGSPSCAGLRWQTLRVSSPLLHRVAVHVDRHGVVSALADIHSQVHLRVRHFGLLPRGLLGPSGARCTSTLRAPWLARPYLATPARRRCSRTTPPGSSTTGGQGHAEHLGPMAPAYRLRPRGRR